MRLLAKFHRWRLAETDYWLPYERQLHSVIISDRRTELIRDVLTDQIAKLFSANRSRNISELAATYAYRCTRFYDVTDEFTLCKIRALNAEGVVQFGGGILSRIRLVPTVGVVNPNRFRLEGATIHDVCIPSVVAPLMATGWIAELEAEGMIRRYGMPRRSDRLPADSPALRQYAELFARCGDVEFLCTSERFDFLRLDDRSIANGPSTGAWIPILDLRELGGLAITPDDNGGHAVSLVEDGQIMWSKPDLVKAIRRIHEELGK